MKSLKQIILETIQEGYKKDSDKHCDGKIGDMTTLNCGKIVKSKSGLTVELMSAQTSSHFTNIVATYFMEGKTKISINCWIKSNNDYDNAMFNMTRSPSATSSDARFYSKVPSKYQDIMNKLVLAHEEFFNGVANSD